MHSSNISGLDVAEAIIRDPMTVHPGVLLSSAVAKMCAARDRCAMAKGDSDDADIEKLRQDARSSCLLVVEDGVFVGILTERDIVRVSSKDVAQDELTVRDVMTSDVITLKQSEFCDPFVVLNLFGQHKIRHLPVVDEQGNILGIVTHESLRHLLRPVDMLRSQTVFEVMSGKVVAASPQISVRDVAQMLTTHRVSTLILAEERKSTSGELHQIATGIITERDIVQFHALELDFDDLQAAKVMSSPLFSVSPESSLWEVQKLMQRYAVRRIVVEGKEGELLGIVTQSSILKALSPVELSNLVEKLKQRVSGLETERLQLLEHKTKELEQEVQARTQDLHLKVEREQLLASIANDVRASLQLEDVLQTAVSKVQALVNCERVAIWKLQPDHSVVIIAEATSEGADSNLGKKILDPCFDAPAWLEAYSQGYTRVVEDIYEREMADCHRELLEGLNIRAKILVPITQNGQLWGIFSATESQYPRQWIIEEVSLLRELSVQLAIAIQQAEAYQRARDELEDRKRAEQRILYNALHDSLTNLPNRSFVINELESAIAMANSCETNQCSILFFDLDRFKIVNDSLGHHTGDQLLKIVAGILKRCLRDGDIAARFGGDEFVVLLKNVDSATVCDIAQRVLTAFRSPIQLKGREVFVTTSIGIVLGGKHYDSPAALLRDADIAMYQAKARWRNCYAIFDETMYAQALRRLNLEREMRQALDRQEFVLYYQPIMALENSQLAGFEALVRWQHPELGFISPGEFIPLAEETGLITELTTWVLETACHQLSDWQSQFSNLSHLKMSVNLSVQDLLKSTFAGEIRHILLRSGLASQCLTLEVTENLLIENIKVTIQHLEELANLGIRISIDDFGTGYSSLQYLSCLPCHNLKIDRSFVSGLEAGDRNNQLVKIIIALSEQLNLDSIAEGIETEQQLDWLKSLGCKFAQGYFFSKPLAASEIEKMLPEQYGALPSAVLQSHASEQTSDAQLLLR